MTLKILSNKYFFTDTNAFPSLLRFFCYGDKKIFCHTAFEISTDGSSASEANLVSAPPTGLPDGNFVFIPKFSYRVYFGGPWNGKC
jgi:hypothetical protein